MSDETTQVKVYLGPYVWFEKQVDITASDHLLDLTSARDAENRLFRVLQNGDSSYDEDDAEPIESVIAFSDDFASLSEHAISNFVGLVRAMNITRLILNNPPARVQVQLSAAFNLSIERYEYPSLAGSSLVKLYNEFEQHLVGQSHVRDAVLSALYPLTD